MPSMVLDGMWRAIEGFVALAREKTRHRPRWSVVESSHVQADLGRAEVELAAARAFAEQAVCALWDAVQTTGQAPVVARVRVSPATQHAMRAAVSVTDTVFYHAGDGVIFTDSALQRCFRDVHTAAQHVFYSAEADHGSRVLVAIDLSGDFAGEPR